MEFVKLFVVLLLVVTIVSVTESKYRRKGKHHRGQKPSKWTNNKSSKKSSKESTKCKESKQSSKSVIDFDSACTSADSDLVCKTSAAVCRDQTCQCPVNMYHDTTKDACMLIGCGAPPDLTKGNIVANDDTKYEDTATVTCDEGHTLVPDTPTLTCLINGTWSDVGTCEPINCPTYTNPDFSYIVSGNGNTEFGSTINVACNEGYITNDLPNVTCKADATWTTSPVCSIKNCPTYTAPGFAIIESGGENTEFGTSITLSCDDGYETNDSLKVTCGANATWSPSSTCTIKHCPTYTAPGFATIESGGEKTEFGTSITLSCDDGYETNDSLEVTCGADAIWTTSPACTVSVCLSVLQASTTPDTLFSHADYNGTKYDNNMDCYWVIEARVGYTIDFSITEMEIENNVYATGNSICLDYVEVFDGRNDTDIKLGKYCGSTVPDTISSTGQYLLVHFGSDSSVIYKGFAAEYKEGGQSIN